MNADSNADKGPVRPAAGRMAALSDRQRNAATSGVMGRGTPGCPRVRRGGDGACGAGRPVRDETLVMLLASQETLKSSLCWCFYHLGGNRTLATA